MQDGRTAVLQPGDFALYDSTRPYELRFDGDFQQYVLMLPGPTLRSQLRAAPELTARGVHGVARRRAPDDRDDPDARRRHRRAGTGRGGRGRPERRAHRGGRAQLAGRGGAGTVDWRRAASRSSACARTRLRDPGLTVAAIAAALHTSVSTLHRAFAGEPCSIAEWIWAQRLDGVRADLCDPTLAHRTISDLAFSWGFVDASHFSRAFRARFGCTAREIRSGQAGGSTTNWRSDRSR